MSDAPLYEIDSHIASKNAKVRLYADRVEWERSKRVSGAKVAAGVMTVGLSLAATGVRTRRGAGVEMIPMKSITSVTQKRDTMLNDFSVITAGNTIDMRCHRKEAGELRALILEGINGTLRPKNDVPEERPATPSPPPPPPPAVPPANWYPDPHGATGLLRYWDGSTWTDNTHQE